MSLAFLSKKSWHTGKLVNQEKAWKAEQQKAAEDKKSQELRRQIAEERELQELHAMNNGGKGGQAMKLDWMYRGGPQAQKPTADEYLRGKAVADLSEQNDVKKIADGGTATPGALWLQKAQSSTAETYSKIRGDPLLAIKRQQLAARDQVLKNPVAMAQVRQRALEHALEKKKRKHKSGRNRGDGGGEEVDDNDNGEERSSKSKKHSKKKHKKEKRKHKKERRHHRKEEEKVAEEEEVEGGRKRTDADDQQHHTDARDKLPSSQDNNTGTLRVMSELSTEKQQQCTGNNSTEQRMAEAEKAQAIDNSSPRSQRRDNSGPNGQSRRRHSSASRSRSRSSTNSRNSSIDLRRRRRTRERRHDSYDDNSASRQHTTTTRDSHDRRESTRDHRRDNQRDGRVSTRGGVHGEGYRDSGGSSKHNYGDRKRGRSRSPPRGRGGPGCSRGGGDAIRYSDQRGYSGDQRISSNRRRSRDRRHDRDYNDDNNTRQQQQRYTMKHPRRHGRSRDNIINVTRLPSSRSGDGENDRNWRPDERSDSERRLKTTAATTAGEKPEISHDKVPETVATSTTIAATSETTCAATSRVEAVAETIKGAGGGSDSAFDSNGSSSVLNNNNTKKYGLVRPGQNQASQEKNAKATEQNGESENLGPAADIVKLRQGYVNAQKAKQDGTGTSGSSRGRRGNDNGVVVSVEERRQQMLADAHEETASRARRQQLDDELEKVESQNEIGSSSTGGPAFISNVRSDMGSQSIESRIRSRAFYTEREGNE